MAMASYVYQRVWLFLVARYVTKQFRCNNVSAMKSSPGFQTLVRFTVCFVLKAYHAKAFGSVRN